MNKTLTLWSIWLIASICGAAILVGGMFFGGKTRAALLIGATTHGHHQIEMSCSTCHTSAFGGTEVIEKTCKSCHEDELKKFKDSHPIKKFRDPRNADRLEKLAANKCITCHTEHKPNITHEMGVTLPTDYCALCHQDVFKNRPSHEGLGFDTCATAGCHNYHDNTALYEDFLEKHNDAPWLSANPLSKQRTEDITIEPVGDAITELALANAPKAHAGDSKIMSEWLASSHAKAGVNCAGCHAPEEKKADKISANWIEKPGHAQCATCHSGEAETWLLGKHGMRMAKDLKVEEDGLYGFFKDKPMSPMRPELARLPMHSDVGHKELSCNSCHSGHSFSTAESQVKACVSCHNDDHTQAYFQSKHYELWKAEKAGTGEKGSGISCASCHMPRKWHEGEWEEVLITNHNQSANLRPNEKMIRSVCMDCHGLGFAIDALADKKLLKNNFQGKPSAHIPSIDWTMKRIEEIKKKKQAERREQKEASE